MTSAARFLFAPFAALLLLAAGCGKSDKPSAAAPAATPAAAPTAPVPPKPRFAVIETDLGTIEFEFLASESPKAVENFQLLTERGYYNGLKFHRIVKDFMIQTGDQGDGRGGESAWGGFFAEDIQKGSEIYALGNGYKRGIVAMANAGPGTNGSQFFILHKDYRLAPTYVIFGRVTKGMEVVDALAEVKTERGPDGGMSKPIKPPVMKKVTLKP